MKMKHSGNFSLLWIPLLDVTLIVLLMFIVAYSKVDQSLNMKEINLAQGKGARATGNSKENLILIAPNQKVFYQDKWYSLDEFKDQPLKPTPEGMYLAIDGEAVFVDINQVVELLKEKNIDKVFLLDKNLSSKKKS